MKRKNRRLNMRITTYRTELNDDKHNILIKENSCNYPINDLRNPETVVCMLNTIYRLNRQAEEHLYMIALNTKCRVLGVFEISHGTINQSICNPRDIFIKALLCGAYGIILAHNHPSGDCSPSKEDIQTHKRILDGGQIVGIQLLDNIIVGDGFYSFKNNSQV